MLVKVHPEGKHVVDVDPKIEISKITTGARVALKNDSYTLHLMLPTKVDPLVSLMKVEKVPDSTYDMVGGLDQQIREIKEVWILSMCHCVACAGTCDQSLCKCRCQLACACTWPVYVLIFCHVQVIELPIKHPELFETLGVAQPKGVLLYGPPGTGKTLLARAVAHHTDCTFIRVSGSELVQKYIGEGSRMVCMHTNKPPTLGLLCHPRTFRVSAAVKSINSLERTPTLVIHRTIIAAPPSPDLHMLSTA